MRPVEETPTKAVDYAALSAGYGALLGAVVLGARDQADPVVRQEIPALGLATFALSKLIAKEKVETWMREPFVEETSQGRRPKGTRLRYAVGELLTCTRCTGAWASLALVALRLHSPGAGRTGSTLLATSAGNDMLQAGFSWLCAHANVEQKAADEPTPARGVRRVA